jgi:hypothetical protein
MGTWRMGLFHHVAAPLPPIDALVPIRKPKSYHPPLLFVSYILTPDANSPIKKVIGHINPCHKPAKKPAGLASGFLYFEFGPATDNILDIVLSAYLFAHNGRVHLREHVAQLIRRATEAPSFRAKRRRPHFPSGATLDYTASCVS